MRKLAVSLSLVGLALPASAQEEEYSYAGFQFGPTLSVDQNLRGDNSDLNLEADKNIGVLAGFYIGRNVDKWRYEFEYAVRRNGFDTANVINQGTLIPAAISGRQSAGGAQQSDSFMVNAHYNFAELGDWKAYAGLGVGFSIVELDEFTVDQRFVASSRNWEPSGQAMFQVTRSLGTMELGLGFRHFRTTVGRFGIRGGAGTYKFVNNEVFARLSWRFGEKASPAPRPTPAPQPAAVARPAPAPAPAPAPEPEPVPQPLPGPFMVFFDFDKSDLTSDARSIIRRAATAFKDFGAARIAASGHTDKAGRNAYNDALAQRRAEAVRDALIAQGVPASRITIRGYGEGSPLVSTDDGVRNWQNRRVEIVLSR